MEQSMIRPRLLLVDDEEAFLAATSRLLGRRGVDVRVARDGREALGMLAAYPVDVVVLDIKMPVMDGEEAFIHIHRRFPRLPIIVLTGHGSIPQAFEMSKGGIHGYVAKPCVPDELAAMIRSAAAQSGSSGEAAGAGQYKPQDHDWPPGTQPRVLLVDDEPALLELLGTALGRRGLPVVRACGGEAALTRLAETAIDVVVLDIGSDGLETLQHIKRRFGDREVILLTDHPNLQDVARGLRMGAFDYLLKPPEVAALAGLIHKARQARDRRINRQRGQTTQDLIERNPDWRE